MHIAKPTLNRRMVLVSLLISSLARSAFADENDPGDFVAEIYRAVGPEAKVSVFADETMRRRFLSRRLREAVRAMERRTPAGTRPISISIPSPTATIPASMICGSGR